MKIAYIGKIQLSDADLSYLNSAQKLSDITYIMEVTPRFMKGPHTISARYIRIRVCLRQQRLIRSSRNIRVS